MKMLTSSQLECFLFLAEEEGLHGFSCTYVSEYCPNGMAKYVFFRKRIAAQTCIEFYWTTDAVKELLDRLWAIKPKSGRKSTRSRK